MNIGKLNIRITFQKNMLTEDEIGNHINEWTDEFSCYATASTKVAETEKESAGQTVNTERISFTVRYCSELKDVTPTTHRIVLGDRIYNIISVDDMAFKHNSLKFYAELERRHDEDSID